MASNNNRPGGGKRPNSPRYSDRYGPGHINPYMGGQPAQSAFIREMEERQEAARRQSEQEMARMQSQQDAARRSPHTGQSAIPESPSQSAHTAAPSEPARTAERRREREEHSQPRAMRDPNMVKRLKQIQEKAIREAKSLARGDEADFGDLDFGQQSADVRLKLSEDNQPLVALESVDSDGRKQVSWVPVVLSEKEMEAFFPAIEPVNEGKGITLQDENKKTATENDINSSSASEAELILIPIAGMDADPPVGKAAAPVVELLEKKQPESAPRKAAEAKEQPTKSGSTPAKTDRSEASPGLDAMLDALPTIAVEPDEAEAVPVLPPIDLTGQPDDNDSAQPAEEDSASESVDEDEPAEDTAAPETTESAPEPDEPPAVPMVVYDVPDDDDSDEDSDEESAEDESGEESSDDGDESEDTPEEEPGTSAEEESTEVDDADSVNDEDESDDEAETDESAEETTEDEEPESVQESSDEEQPETEDAEESDDDKQEDSDDADSAPVVTDDDVEDSSSDDSEEEQSDDQQEEDSAGSSESDDEQAEEERPRTEPRPKHKRRRSRPTDVQVPAELMSSDQEESQPEESDEDESPVFRRTAVASRPVYDELNTSDRYVQSKYQDDEQDQDDRLFVRRARPGATALFVPPKGTTLPKYIDDDDFVERWLGEGEDEDMASLKRSRRRKIAAFVGAASLVLALVGLIAITKWGIGLLGGLGNSESQKEIYGEFISPVVMSEVPEFEAWDAIPQDKLLQSAVFSVMMDMDVTYERDDTGKFIVPSTDVVNAVKKLYGAYSSDPLEDEEINTQIRNALYGSAGEDVSSEDVYYVDLEDSFHVADGLSGPAPNVTDISRRDDSITLDVEYMEDLEIGSGGTLYSRELILTLTEDGSYYVKAIRELQE